MGLFLGDKGDKGVIAHCLSITQWNLELSTFSSYSIDIDCQRIDIPDDIRLTYDKACSIEKIIVLGRGVQSQKAFILGVKLQIQVPVGKATVCDEPIEKSLSFISCIGKGDIFENKFVILQKDLCIVRELHIYIQIRDSKSSLGEL